jgi:hypothetical protein
MTASDHRRLFIGVALAAVGGGILFGYTQMSKSEDGAWGLGSLLAGLVVIYLVLTWQTEAKSLLYKRGLLVCPGLLFVLWGAGMLCKAYKAPEIVSDVLTIGVLLAAAGGCFMVIVGEIRRSRKGPANAGSSG